MGILRSPSFRIGQIENTCGKWDNGFYTEGYIHNLPLQMLIDNGSTCSILNHRIYLKRLDTTKDKIILTVTWMLQTNTDSWRGEL